jgi:hypothetical protein
LPKTLIGAALRERKLRTHQGRCTNGNVIRWQNFDVNQFVRQ